MKSSKPIVKVCGITQENDVTELVEAGVNWFGINLYEPSPRSVDLKLGLRNFCRSSQLGKEFWSMCYQILLSYKLARLLVSIVSKFTSIQKTFLLLNFRTGLNASVNKTFG